MDVNENNDFVVSASIQIYNGFDIRWIGNEMGHYIEIGQQAFGPNRTTYLQLMASHRSKDALIYFLHC